jgi:hypothetical protein
MTNVSTHARLGIRVPETHLPRPGIDLSRWAVVACDQYTSEPEYWRKVEEIVGHAPSTLNLIFPEAYLERPDSEARIARIQATMKGYLESGVLAPCEGFIYVERAAGGKSRRGLMMCLDLEHYDYGAASTSLIRPTESTLVERLAPRIKIRDGAELELPHILVLIDDPEQLVIEPIGRQVSTLECLYDIELMQGGGRVAGYRVNDALAAGVVPALAELACPDTFADKYGVDMHHPVLLFAVGDGNHSLATAKTMWERIKASAGMDHPARYALVEVQNIHDDGLDFEPIHRVLFGVKRDVLGAMKDSFGTGLRYEAVADMAAMKQAVKSISPRQAVGIVRPDGRFGVAEFMRPPSKLCVGTLQPFLDRFVSEGGAVRTDYLHGDEVLQRVATQPACAGFYLSDIEKTALFRTVILEGTLPRKTFSMGQAHEKRFYVEARRIRR